MTEPPSERPPRDRRMTTGEFRATPDISASTAQFRAFADRKSGDQTRQWAAIDAPGRNATRLGLLILAVVVVVAIIAILAVVLG
ncbi:MAG: hypothetical protein J2P28_03145 [Actinobacteria bacterium]|nr:hypothetical protein [Actinomycetota bacterium]MBO0834500.1 hypothetical protein [Actinomycetota bacterium]